MKKEIGIQISRGAFGNPYYHVSVYDTDRLANLHRFWYAYGSAGEDLANVFRMLRQAGHGDALDSLFGSGTLGICFLITTLFLLLTEWVGKKMQKRQDLCEEVGIKHALCMGVMQAVAILPGVSRSGSTLLGGIFSGMKREKAAKFSFMMSAPAILGSLLVEGKDLLENGGMELLSANLVPVIVGVVLSAVSGYLAIRYMLKLINRISFNWFALYVGIVGVTVIVLQLCGVSFLPAFPFFN